MLSQKIVKICHQSKYISDSKYKKKSKASWSGSKMRFCHEDFHQGTLGKECSGCHSTEKFKTGNEF
ncbi:MAG: hypothetical protein IPH97_15005 [Ignavibacteriales bacterium]|nr:hypothetical protein [Ignavibacteriales bacterium]